MPQINICFPSDPMSNREVDPEYLLDAQEFAKLGAGVLLWDQDSPGAKVRACPKYDAHPNAPVAWRGWMLTSQRYGDWTRALGEKSPRFDVAQYEQHHRMRNWLPAVQGFTPKAWFIQDAHDARMEMFPCHVKDGVKSANAKNLPRPCQLVEDIVQHQQELVRQRGALDDGLVLREHVDAFETETRVWIFGQDAVDVFAHAEPGAPAPSLDWLRQALGCAPSSFFDAPFTMDIARTKTGKFFVMDMGDAGVSDYKEGHRAPSFLHALRARWYEKLCEPAPALALATPSPSGM